MRQIFFLLIFTVASFGVSIANPGDSILISVKNPHLPVFEKGSMSDNGIRPVIFTVSVSKLPLKSIAFQLVIKTNNASSAPVLTTSKFSIKREQFKNGTYSFEDTIKLKAVSCLLKNDTMSIELHNVSLNGNDPQKSPKSGIDNFFIDKMIIPDYAEIALLPGETEIQPYLKSDNPADSIRNIKVNLRLAGKSTEDYDVEFGIPSYEQSRSKSKPGIVNNYVLRIPKEKFDTNGCPVYIPDVPVTIGLKPVDSLTGTEKIPVLIINPKLQNEKEEKAHYIVFSYTKKTPTRPPGTNNTDTGYSFTYACISGRDFKITLWPDTGKRTIQVTDIAAKKTASYIYTYKFEKGNFRIWLLNNFSKLIPDSKCPYCFCVDELADVVFEELKRINKKVEQESANKEKTGNPPAAGAATGPAAATTEKTKKEDAGTIFHLDKGESSMNPFYSKKDSSTVYTVRMIIFCDKKPEKDTTLTLITEKRLFPFQPEIRSQNPVKLSKNQWLNNPNKTGGDTSKFYQELEVDITNLYVDTLTKDLSAFIRIKDGDESFHALRLTEKGMYQDKSFWVDMGMNFDLFDNIKANNFYTGVFMFVKDVWNPFKPSFKKSKEERDAYKKQNRFSFSFTGGVYETKSIELNVVSDSGLIYRDARSYRYDAVRNGYPIFQDSGTVSTSSTISNLGIFFSPHLRLNNKATEENGFHIFASLYFEMLWQRIVTNFEYDKTKAMDTIFASYKDSIYKTNFKSIREKTDFRSQYIGVGLPIYIKEDKFTFYMNSVFGFTNQKYQILQDTDTLRTEKNYKLLASTALTGVAKPKHSWNPFLLLQFRLTEEHVGISITGEVRTMLLKNTKPVITLALSKKFDLEALYHAVTKSF